MNTAMTVLMIVILIIFIFLFSSSSSSSSFSSSASSSASSSLLLVLALNDDVNDIGDGEDDDDHHHHHHHHHHVHYNNNSNMWGVISCFSDSPQNQQRGVGVLLHASKILLIIMREQQDSSLPVCQILLKIIQHDVGCYFMLLRFST